MVKKKEIYESSSEEEIEDEEIEEEEEEEEEEIKENEKEKIVKLDNFQHYLKKPSMYIGRTKKIQSNQYLYDEDEAMITYEDMEISPGLFKIIDEILVNAADRVIESDCTEIKIDVDMDSGWITVRNNGKSMPTRFEEKYGMYFPQIAFAESNSSTHFDETKVRKGGGTHGIGAKATGVFSKTVNIEILDTNTKDEIAVKYTQIFENNLSKINSPKIIKLPNNKLKSYTQYSFLPDYKRFDHPDGLEENDYKWIQRRCLEISINANKIKDVNVYFNDELIQVKTISEYVDLFLPDYNSEFIKVNKTKDKSVTKEVIYEDEELTKIRWMKCIEEIDDWTVCVLYDPNKEMEKHEDVSFVNSVNTYEGGTHLRVVSNNINNKIIKEARGKKKDEGLLKKSDLKNYLVYFIISFIENPEFDQQSKFKLVTTEKELNSIYEPSEKFLKMLITKELIMSVRELSDFNSLKTLTKEGKRTKFTVIPNHTNAESNNRTKCTLFLTEGSSASTAVSRGFKVIGHEFYGCFQLRGKITNPRDLSYESLKKKLSKPNSATMNLIRVIGLEIGKEYDSFDKLQYRHIIAFMDEDLDGSHIKCLVINFFQCLWPSLFEINDGKGSFIKLMRTPLVVITKNVKGKDPIEKLFYTLKSYDDWKKNSKDKGWSVPVYYKGMGGHGENADKLFENLDEKLINVEWSKEYNEIILKDYKQTIYKKDASLDSLLLAFGKPYSSNRRNWINKYNPENELDLYKKSVTIPEMIHYDLKPFSVSDNIRSIPSLIDGFKPVQRQIYYVMMNKGIIKLLQIAGDMLKKVNYHHGDASVHQSVFNMGQLFAGSNNICLFDRIGEFGTRQKNGEDNVAARYASAGLNTLSQKIYRSEDFDILPRKIDSGKIVGPEYFIPIIPIVLCNDRNGTGTGWKCEMQPCNPLDVIDNTIRKINKKELKKMLPWFHNFLGTVEESDEENKYVIKGSWEVKEEEPDFVYIYDLPIGTHIISYIEELNNQIAKNLSKRVSKKKEKEEQNSKVKKKKLKNSEIIKNIIDLSNRSSGNNIWIKLKFTKGYLDTVEEDEIESGLGLTKKINNLNMSFFNGEHKLKKYISYEDIFDIFYPIRLKYYKKRKENLIKSYNYEILKLENLIRYLKMLSKDKLRYSKKGGQSKTKQEINEELEELEFDKLGSNYLDDDEENYNYKYLRNTKTTAMELEKMNKMEEKLKDLKNQLDTLQKTRLEDIWLSELDELKKEYIKWYDHYHNKFLEDDKKIKKGIVIKTLKRGKK